MQPKSRVARQFVSSFGRDVVWPCADLSAHSCLALVLTHVVANVQCISIPLGFHVVVHRALVRWKNNVFSLHCRLCGDGPLLLRGLHATKRETGRDDSHRDKHELRHASRSTITTASGATNQGSQRMVHRELLALRGGAT